MGQNILGSGGNDYPKSDHPVPSFAKPDHPAPSFAKPAIGLSPQIKGTRRVSNAA